MPERNTLKGMMDEARSQEYRARVAEKNRAAHAALTMDFQLGYFVGMHIVDRHLPTLSTDSVQTRRVVQVTQEEADEHGRLNALWFSIRERPGDDVRWANLRDYTSGLARKHLPARLECRLDPIRYDDEAVFKSGLREALWDCDACWYSIRPDDIVIEQDFRHGCTMVALSLDPDVE